VTFQGPADQDYVIDDIFTPSAQVWSPCGASRALNINVQASVSGSYRSAGLISVDSPLGATLGQLKIKWRRC
jgi:hypothetical protein